MLDTAVLIHSIKDLLTEAERNIQSQIDSLANAQQTGSNDGEMAELYAAAIAALEKVKEQTTLPTRIAIATEIIKHLSPMGIPLSVEAKRPRENLKNRRPRRTKKGKSA